MKHQQQQPINRSAYRKVDIDSFIAKYCREPSHEAVIYPKSELEDVELNRIQKRLYKEVVYGLRAYPQRKLAKMPEEQKQEIIETYKKASNQLNFWKQKILRDLSTAMVTKCWYDPLARLFMTPGLRVDPDFRVKLTFNQLGIRQDQIIAHLIKCRILPKNFYELKEE